MTYSNTKQRGFTLIELLVVIGIIAALAAVVIPNVSRFMGAGQTAADQAEFTNVQTAVDAWLADPLPSAPYADVAVATSDMNAAGLEPDYLRQPTTNCTYTWAAGLVAQVACP